MHDFTFLCIEDEQKFIDKLKTTITQYFKERDYKVKLLCYEDIPQTLDLKSIDACFLDIVIKEHDALDWLKTVGSQIYNMPIIPITNYEGYMKDAIHFHVFDFIKKNEFDQVIDHTLHELLKYLKSVNEVFPIFYNGNTYKIKIQNIQYIETKSHYVYIHCLDNEGYEIWKSYDEVFTHIYPSLVRTHRSYVVNINNCEKIMKNRIQVHGVKDVIPISKTYYSEVYDKFMCSMKPIR